MRCLSKKILVTIFVMIKVFSLNADTTICKGTCLFYAVPNGVNAIDYQKAGQFIVRKGGIKPVAVDINYARKEMFWSDIGKRTISRASLDGTATETIVQNAGTCEGLAVDWISGLLFWTNSYHKRIEVSHLDGTDRALIITNGLDLPRALAVHPKSSSLFWTDWGIVPKIEKATMSGENRKTLVHTDILFPNGLVIDHSTSPKRLFWTDAGGDYIQSINLDGHDRQKILKKSAVNPRRPFGITILHDNLYFSDWKTGNIYAIKKSNGVLQAIQKTTESGTEEKTIMGLVMSDKSRQPEGLSACGTNNGGCSNLCLPNLNGVKCFCPDGVHLNADGKTCSKLKDFLIFADAIFQTIYTIPISTTTQIAQPVIFPSKHNSTTPIAVEYDVTDERLYWTDISLKTISRAYLNGSGFQVLHKTNIEQPEGIAIDIISRTIYWTDSKRSVIEVSGVDGTSRRTLIHTSTQVRDVQVDFRNGNILWTEWCKDSIKAKIGRANMDGSFQSVLISKGVCFPNGLTLDQDNNILYWMDAKLNHIESYNFTNGERKILNNHYIGWDRLSIYMEHPFGLTTNGDLIFWTDWATSSVYGAKQNSGTNGKRLVAALGKPMDIVASSGLSPDALLPEIFCPSDYSLYNKNKYSLMTRLVKQATLKKASPQKSNIVCSPNEVLLKSYGVYTVSCTANSYGKKSSSCSYRLWVKDHFCQRLTPPMNGKILCKTHCTVTCDERFVLAKSMTKEMVCSGQRWRPLMNKQVNLLPACLEERLPKALEIISSFAFKEACNKLDQQELTSKFRIKLEEVILKIKEAKEVSTDVTIKEIKLTCSDKDIWLSEGRFKTLKVVFTLILNSSDNQIISDRILNPKRKADATKSILLQSVNNGQFTLVLHGKSIEAKPDSYSGTELAVCNLGEVKKRFYCIRCLLGMYANETTGDCEPCPVGYYQNKEGQTGCLKCPANTSTVVMGTETHLGCYGNGILVGIETESNIRGVKIFQDVMASIINEYCEQNVCPMDEDEIIDRKQSCEPAANPADIPPPIPRRIRTGVSGVLEDRPPSRSLEDRPPSIPTTATRTEALSGSLEDRPPTIPRRIRAEASGSHGGRGPMYVTQNITNGEGTAAETALRPIDTQDEICIPTTTRTEASGSLEDRPASRSLDDRPPSIPTTATRTEALSGSLEDRPPSIPMTTRAEASGSHEVRGIYVKPNITNREDTAAETALWPIDMQDETCIPTTTRTEASGSLEDRPPPIPPRIITEASRSLEVRPPSIPTTTRAEASGSHEVRGIYVEPNITNREDTAAETALRLTDLQDKYGYTRLLRHTASAED